MKIIFVIAFFWGMYLTAVWAQQVIIENRGNTIISLPADQAFQKLSARDQAKAIKKAEKEQENTENKKKQLIKKYEKKSRRDLIRKKESLQEWLERSQKKDNQERIEKITLEIEVLNTLLAQKEVKKK